MHKLFRTNLQLWKFLNEDEKVAQKLDYPNTLRLPMLTFITKEGVLYRSGDIRTFATHLVAVFGLDIDVNISRKSGKFITLFFNNTKDEKEVIMEKIVSVDDILPEIELQTTVSEVTTPFVDWDWINSLKSTQQSKKDLDRYATKFGIELKANKKISDMIEDFKVGLAQL